MNDDLLSISLKKSTNIPFSIQIKSKEIFHMTEKKHAN